MNSFFDICSNCVKVKADIKSRGLQLQGSGVFYPLNVAEGYDYVSTAQHIPEYDRKEVLNAVSDKIETIEIGVSKDGRFIAYKTITKGSVTNPLLSIGKDLLIIRVGKDEKHSIPLFSVGDLIEGKSVQLCRVLGKAQDIIARLDRTCVDSRVNLISTTSHVDNMDSLYGVSGGGVFARNQLLTYGISWKYAVTNGEFHNIKVIQELEEETRSQLIVRKWKSLNFVNIAQCKQAIDVVYDNVFRGVNDSILVNHNNTRLPLEVRFIVPNFIDEVQNLYSDDQGKIEEKSIEVDPTNLCIKSSKIQEYSEQYLREFYNRQNKTNNREIRTPVLTILDPNSNILLIVRDPGSGRSSLLKYFTLQLPGGKMNACDGYLSAWMPFSYMARNRDGDIKSIVQDWLQENRLWEKNSYYLEYVFEQ